MGLIYGAYMDLFAALLLAVLLMILIIKKDYYTYDEKILFILTILGITLLISEAITYSVDGIDNKLAWTINYWMNFILFLLTPVLGVLWAVYIDYALFHSMARLRKFLFFSPVIIIGVILSFINFFVPVLYSISDINVFQREPLIYVNMATLYVLFMISLYNVLRYRKTLSKVEFVGLHFFLLFPMIGGTLQILVYGIASMYSMLALGIFSVYITVETVGTNRDFLTGLFTRKKVYEYMAYLIDSKLPFTTVLFDLDDFKDINDQYGHSIGDKALVEFSKILASVFTEKAIVSRIGGDEFLIISNNTDSNYIQDLVSACYHKIEQVDSPYSLRFAVGIHIQTEPAESSDSIMVQVDKKMYEHKAKNKNYKRRQTDR